MIRPHLLLPKNGYRNATVQPYVNYISGSHFKLRQSRTRFPVFSDTILPSLCLPHLNPPRAPLYQLRDMDLRTAVAICAPPPSPRIPHELCLLIIDALGSDFDNESSFMSQSTVDALRNCALACPEWWSRAHRWIKTTIVLRDINPSPLLSTGFGNTAYTHITCLSLYFSPCGRYSASGALSALSRIFKFRTPSLTRLSMLPDERTPLPSRDVNVPSLPHLPLYPYLNRIISPMLSTVVHLRIWFITFRNFSDFGRFLHPLTVLETLDCDTVRWSTLGVVPGCMRSKVRSPFLPRLRKLVVCPQICLRNSY